MTLAIAETKQAELEAEALIEALVNEGLCRPDEAEAVLAIKVASLAKRELDKAEHKPSPKKRVRRKPSRTILDYHGLTGVWESYLKVAQTYEGKIPIQDRDDVRHDIMVELNRAEQRDGKPLPLLRAYRIASICVALFYRSFYRFSVRVCVYNGYPSEPHCEGCKNKSDGKRCMWLAVRPVASLDSEIIDPDGYRLKLLDTVATDQALDLPEKWYEVNEVRLGLPLRLVEIAYKRLEGKPLDKKDQKYLERYRKKAQLSLF